MGKPKKGKWIGDKILNDSSLTACTVIEKVEGIDTLICRIVKGYDEYKKNGDWGKVIEAGGHRWKIGLALQDDKPLASISMSTFHNNVEFKLYDPYDVVTEEYSIIPKENGYIAEFKETLDSKGNPLKDDFLKVHCCCIDTPVEHIVITIPGFQEESNEVDKHDLLCNDLERLYLTSYLSDFKIRVKTFEFKVHKLLLIARSSSVESTPFQSTDYLEIDACPAMMHEVLLYIYSGQLKKLPIDKMLQVFNIACILSVESLQQKCIDYFKANFRLDNLGIIFDGAKLYDQRLDKRVELRKELFHFINKQPDSVRKSEKWSQVDFLLLLAACD